MYILIARVTRHLYTSISGVTWDVLLLLTITHFATSWTLIAATGAEELAARDVFWYFYITTSTTVGYGDFSPTTLAGRMVTALWIMPGGIALFTAIIAKVVQQIADKWRQRLRGQASYENLSGHVVILGWLGERTRRMVDQFQGDGRDGGPEIVLCTDEPIENPMPDRVKFVRDISLSAPDLLRRAAVDKADYVIAVGRGDDETLAAALGATAVIDNAHLVAYFEKQEFADLLSIHCPGAECNVSLSIELMVRSAQDPGSSRIQRQLLSTLVGPTQYSMQVPDDVGPFSYAALFAGLKQIHAATLFGVANSKLGDDLVLNAPSDLNVIPGMIVYFMAARRIDASEIDWPSLSRPAAA